MEAADTKETIDGTLCVKCQSNVSSNEDLQDVKRGITTLISYATKINDILLLNHLKTKQKENCPVKIHPDCQKEAYNILKRKSLDQTPSDAKQPKLAVLRKQVKQFQWKENCFICGDQCIEDKKHPDRNPISMVTLLGFHEKLLLTCSKRDDALSKEVERRLLSCNDLVAADGRYHKKCYFDFCLTNKETAATPGRPIESEQQKCFELACEWLEKEAEMYTLKEIREKMQSFTSGDVYSEKWTKKKLKKYKESVFFAEVNGKPNVVCFQNFASYLISDLWYSKRKQNVEEEAVRVIKLAAKIILADVRASNFKTDKYPSTYEIENKDIGLDWLPPYLKLLIENLIKDKLKQVSIGQAVVNAARPRSVIPPVLFGLGIELDHIFGSRWLLTELNRLGFSVSSEEVTRYKQSVVENENLSEYIKCLKGSFSQFSADNIDHNVRTIDGQNTFHAMGIICSTTGKHDGFEQSNSHCVTRQPRKKVADIIKKKGIEILNYNSEERGLLKIKFKHPNQLQTPYIISEDTNMDFLWHIDYFVRKTHRPNWSGYMEEKCQGNSPGKSIINILTIIDLDPTNMSCIFSTITFIIEQSKILDIKTPVLTFDQPLRLKAMEIVNSKNLNVVLLLGGFHMLMSFCGSIGHLMKGSGLLEAWSTIYGSNVVEHMSNGKAISRALRAHFLTESALTTKLLKQLYEESDILPAITDINEAVSNDPDITVDIIDNSTSIRELNDHLNIYKDHISTMSRTCRLWVQYLFYIDVIKKFIRASRTGNWLLHLHAVFQMLNLFAAAGRIHYAKSARLYLQNMQDLPNSYPDVYQKFVNDGCSSVRRSEKYWSGVWTDLTIEQELMRSLKSRGGLTRGRGITESVRMIWTNSMHRCAEVHKAMGILTNQHHMTSEQHKDLQSSRIERDNKDLELVIKWFDDHEPFDLEEPLLKSLSSGMTSCEGDNINCDKAEDVGRSIQMQLNDLSYDDATIKRKDHVHTLAELLPGIKIDQQKFSPDSTYLFMRLTAIMSDDNIVDCFKYELTPEPVSLFKNLMMRKATKSVLRNKLLDSAESFAIVKCDAVVIDGGAFIHKVLWPQNAKFKDVIDQYIKFLKSRYKSFSSITVVFDGYEANNSTKEHEQMRRGSMMSNYVAIQKNSQVTTKRDMFLRNPKDKQQLIRILMTEFEAVNIKAFQAESDADCLIAKSVLELSSKQDVAVAAEDTDILVLLCYHWNKNLHNVYFCTERTEACNKIRRYWNIKDIVDGFENVQHLLFAHAWSGCDTTSAFYQQGKMKILNHLSSPEIRSISRNFGDLNATHTEIAEAGEKLVLKSYNGKADQSLAKLRYTKYMDMVSTSSAMKPEKLPPTQDSLRFHSFRVHLQVCQWKYLNTNVLNVTDWGWYYENGRITPKLMELDPAPEWLINVFRCKCKTGTRNQCGTMLCSCRKNGLKCIAACANCHGESCNNAKVHFEPIACDLDDEDDEEFNRNIFDLF